MESSLLKQRLIGAITLVVLGVLIIPVILNGPPDSRRTSVIHPPVIETATPQSAYKPPAVPVTVRVDSSGNATADPVRKTDKTKKKPASYEEGNGLASVVPVSAGSEADIIKTPEPPKKQEKAASPSPLLTSQPIDRYSSVDDVDDEVKSEVSRKPQAAKKTTRPAVKRAAPSKPKQASRPKRQRYVIQLGVFGEQSNAIKLQRRLEKLGYRVTVDKQFTRDDAVYRVYVGPYPHRQAADASREALLRRAKLRGFLKNYP